MANKEKTETNFEDLSIKDLMKKYVGSMIYVDGNYMYETADVTAAVATLAGMIKERNVEIKCLQDKVEFLEKIINQVFKVADKQ